MPPTCTLLLVPFNSRVRLTEDIFEFEMTSDIEPSHLVFVRPSSELFEKSLETTRAFYDPKLDVITRSLDGCELILCQLDDTFVTVSASREV